MYRVFVAPREHAFTILVRSIYQTKLVITWVTKNSGLQWKLRCLQITTKQAPLLLLPLLLLMMMMTTFIMTCLFTVIIQWGDIFIRQDGSLGK
jgi:hypothetical protein